MTYTKYQELARRTESVPMEWEADSNVLLEYRLVHMQLGLLTEAIELKHHKNEANEVEEIGDVFWYLDGACHVMGYNMSEIYDCFYSELESGMDLVLGGTAKLADILKRKIYYRREDETFREKVRYALSMILTGLMEIIDGRYAVSYILEKNIQKLQIRYPEKYSDHQAVNRNLEGERNVFEAS